MLIYLSHSLADSRICRKLKTVLEENGHIVTLKNNPLEFYSSLSAKGKLRIDLSSMAVVLLTENGRTSYRVHQEMGYMKYSYKDFLLVENNGLTYVVHEFLFGRNLLIGDQLFKEKENIKTGIDQFIREELQPADSFVFHTNEFS